MPFIANTPESLVGRSDSRNPATTCRGITAGGRPCRRPIPAVQDGGSGGGGGGGGGGRQFGSRLRSPNPRRDDPGDERLYCWQHKEQASSAAASARSSPGPRRGATAATPILLEARTSLDTLADRLNLLSTASAPARPKPPPPPPGPPPGPPRPRSVSFCCCFTMPLDDDGPPLPPARPRPRPQRPDARPAPSSRTAAPSLSLIPAATSPQTASALLAELAKPVSLGDEPGYIYMFWLTPESQNQQARPLAAEAARSLLSPPARSAAGAGQRRPSDIVASFAGGGGGGGSTGGSTDGTTGTATLLLKIGRATNVQRRLNEWKRQCGYDLSLLRYYPYVPSGAGAGPSTPASQPPRAPRKMPHSHKVERLIHIELAGSGLRVTGSDKCSACGREHREWFRVEATRKAVAAVDEVIRRWSDWDEGRFA